MDNKTGFTYGILVKNTHEQHLMQMNTFLYSPFKKTEYALIERIVHPDDSEQCVRIIYSHDLEKLKKQMINYVCWYDKVNGYKKELQGNIYVI